MAPSLLLAFLLSVFFAIGAHAESHTIKFVNQCGFGSPALMLNGNNVLNGDEYTSNGPFSGIAYLQTGYCNTNGENCTLMEMTLINSACVGCGSSADLSLIPPHAYSVETSFAYYDGCDGVGQTCSSPNCQNSAFFVPTDNFVQKECQTDNVNLLISFCSEASGLVGGAGSAPPSGASNGTNNAPTPSTNPPSPQSTPTETPPANSPPSSASTTPASPSTAQTLCSAGSRRKRQNNNIPGRFRRRRRTTAMERQNAQPILHNSY
ncbi:hypothetical protein SCLCIDRAFT_1223971 [Scleroderma citrinum Foug A]|uniref:Glycopeptide n=1 Tax=Scleroderma citrinum Foug A TaxID=1036808 RepID=A0A0C3D7V1_9AGAM|nr:hypothetical protein SCLCIDRAFT_1223971 [Scleroderma citrinum Foug A]